MAALAFCLLKRLIGCALCLLAGAAIHPLVAMTGMVLVATLAAHRDRRTMLAIAVTMAVGILAAAAGVEPFARLFVSFDPEWFRIVWKRCGFSFLSRWSAFDVLHLLAVASTLWVAHTFGGAIERRLIVRGRDHGGRPFGDLFGRRCFSQPPPGEYPDVAHALA